MTRRNRSLSLYAACLTLLAALPGAAADWHHPLYLDGGGYWRTRVRVAVTNEMDRPVEGGPVAVRVGPAPGEADLTGVEAKSVRVVSEQGVEMLFGLARPDGEAFDSGPIPLGASLVLPVECTKRGTAVYYIYCDNPAAGQSPDMLSARVGLVNGDVESGAGPAPAGWQHDEADAGHRAEWTSEKPQSGKRCLKTAVDAGAEPAWIATRQHGIPIASGARYRMTAWVRAENVKGIAGWYIHVGNRENAMLISPMLNGGEGTYDWKEVKAEFTAPAGANLADLGTVLRGTGTAWFDNAALECLDPPKLRAEADRPQRLHLKELGGSDDWHRGMPPEHDAWRRRAVVRAFNFAGQDSVPLVAIDSGMFNSRLGGRLHRASVRAVHMDKAVPCTTLGDWLLIEGILPPRSAATYLVYYSAEPGTERAGGPDYAALAASPRNLLKNHSFEDGEGALAGWEANPGGGQRGIQMAAERGGPPGLGQRCAKLHVPHDAPKGWRGWQQSVAVRPGGTYLVGAWVRSEDLRGGELRLHMHVHTSDGGLSKTDPMRGTSSSIGGTTGWTLLSGAFAMPEDAASLRLHLTMDATGTVWHDGAMVAEVTAGSAAAMEGRPVEDPNDVRLWPVNALIKVFQDEPAPEAARAAAISLARNEQEPLQVAVRSGRAWQGVGVEVDPPAGPKGAKLGPVEVCIVGYVPIDCPTNYYQSTTPAWRRKVPASPPACDGFAGMWPDPLLPRDTFDLSVNSTQAIWLTVAAGKDAPAGDYRGAVRLTAGGRTIGEMPFSVRVWDFVLPDESHVKAVYDARLGPGGEQWGRGLDEAYPEIVRFLARRRLCPDAIRPSPRLAYRDGKATADFAAFDKAAAWYFDELRLPHSYTPWDFYLFGWGFPPKTFFGLNPYEGELPFASADRNQLRPEYKKAYQACLRLFWEHLKERGWEKKVVLYISDEPFYSQQPILEQMKALCAMIHEVDPAIPVYSSTWRHVPDWDQSLDVWGIGHYGVVPVEQMARIRSAGKRIWFTTDGQMCTDTPYCAVERLLPHYCFQFGAEAYEFWGAAWTTYDPYRYGWHAYIHQSDQPGKSYWVRYPNGDGFLIYPGKPIGHAGPVSSVRLEQAREGVEDFEYLCLLRELAARAKASGRDAAAGERALAQAAALVQIPNAGGRYSTKIMPDPDAVLRVKWMAAEAIESLSKP